VISFLIWGIINAMLALFLLAMVISFWSANFGCALSLDNWLVCNFICQMCHLCRRFILIGVWIKAKDPAIQQTKFDLVFIVLVVLPELGLYVYGNCIIYS